MPWPQTVDYNSAIQNPEHCFADPDLARGVAVDGLIPGIPLSYTGSFAAVYKVEAPAGVWAVKCFTRKVENLAQRYKEISDHLKRHKRRFTVEFEYLENGIRLDNEWYPVVKMQWVEGFTLNEFLRERVGNPGLLEQLCQLWLRLGNQMRDEQMAHGDLQHGNVMLVPSVSGSLLLRLVDYDGMWVPALEKLPPNEVGHPNYQHPQRLDKGGYSADIDRFAHLAIYTALRCLVSGGKALWSAHDNQENVLFREADFRKPRQSKLFARLLSLPDENAATLAAHLLLASQGSLARTPSVNELLSETSVRPLSAEQIDKLRLLGLSLGFLEKSSSPAQPSGEERTRATEQTVSEGPAIAQAGTAAELPSGKDQLMPDPMGVPFEHRRVAADLFARANEVVAQNNDVAYATQLLLGACKLDPVNLEYRKLLRDVGRKAASKVGGLLGSLTNLPARGRMRTARSAHDHRKVLEHGEELLSRVPGDVAAQIEMSAAAEALGLEALAVWLLKEAHHHAPTNLTILRAFAHLCFRLERFGAAAAIWHQIHQALPHDAEAAAKVKELAAWEAVARTTTLV